MRLFVAVNLPDHVRRAIASAAAPLRGASFPIKWVEPDGLHLTLKFLGEVEADRQAAVVQALGRACHGARPFELLLGGFGAFPSAARARVVWLGCDPVPALELLQHGVEREYAALGFPVEGRPFRPHLTLGRARATAGAGVGGLAARLGELAFADAVTVRSIDLMESTLTPAGARYAVRHAVPLGA